MAAGDPVQPHLSAHRVTMTGRSLESLYDLLGHRFEHPDLLLEALTHPSVEQSRRDLGDYDRLEFLGDRVLALLDQNNYSIAQFY